MGGNCCPETYITFFWVTSVLSLLCSLSWLCAERPVLTSVSCGVYKALACTVWLWTKPEITTSSACLTTACSGSRFAAAAAATLWMTDVIYRCALSVKHVLKRCFLACDSMTSYIILKGRKEANLSEKRESQRVEDCYCGSSFHEFLFGCLYTEGVKWGLKECVRTCRRCHWALLCGVFTVEFVKYQHMYADRVACRSCHMLNGKSTSATLCVRLNVSHKVFNVSLFWSQWVWD